MVQVAHWHGTQEELHRLVRAIEQNCACPVGGAVGCSAHAMLQEDRVLDHLLYVYRTIQRFQCAEWTCIERWSPSGGR